MLGAMFKKVGMTRFFDEVGAVIPVVVLKMETNRVVGFRTVEKDGYSAVMIGYGDGQKGATSPIKGFYKDLPVSRAIREFRIEGDAELSADKKGAVVSLSSFADVGYVDVRGVTIGRGFQGVVRRYGMRGGPSSHGSHFHRKPGSVGHCADPSRIFKGKKMPGRMGGKSVCVQNVQVVGVDEKDGIILVRGAVPGARGSVVELRPSVKKGSQSAKYVFSDAEVS